MKDKEIQGMQIRICNACKQYKKCDKELCTMSGIVAKELSKFYQPKLSENSVVLSREEYEKYQNLKRDVEHSFEYNQGYTDGQIKGSKETAEKIFDKLWHSEIETTVTVKNSSDEDVEKVVKGILCSIRNRVKELAKQFGVEI